MTWSFSLATSYNLSLFCVFFLLLICHGGGSSFLFLPISYSVGPYDLKMKSTIPRILPQLFILKNFCGRPLIDPTPLTYPIVWFLFLHDIVCWWGFTLRSWFGLLRFNFQHLFNLAFLPQFYCFVLSFTLYIGSIFQFCKTLFFVLLYYIDAFIELFEHTYNYLLNSLSRNYSRKFSLLLQY